MNTKFKQLIDTFDQKKIDALLITKDVNIRYLTGFAACESWLLVCRKKVFYITDFRYVLEARQGLAGIASVKQYKKSIYAGLFDLVEKGGVKRLGFDENCFTVAQYKVLKKMCSSGVKLCAANNCVEVFRETKDIQEVKHIREALKIHGQAYNMLKKVVRPGLSERDILLKLENFVKAKGAGFSFDTIIASGPNSCYPHAHVTDRKLRRDEPVLIDMGIDLNGYKSDLTRMFFLGRMPQLVRQVNDHVDQSQRRAIAKIKAGVPVADVDRAARSYLAKHRLAKYFGHALGHGVGLDIHEDPRLSQKSPAFLKSGMVITVEPAVYIPEQFGIRIEDMVLVTENGCEILSDNIH
ncbi:Aminopeptidase YpdF (MP-, MA-, MS-, AP-, NP-specific) [hydrothermal vent metagenome]|uniref:Aminopeptidase YpdF (MP-, MA-, MS-, AP-, NP-specific) n=1 Tax=hydrothermal vent metagenome TaxID=652676 RepID=A0A3B1DRS5_9ZZZZ